MTRGANGAYFYIEQTGYRRYVNFWDVKVRQIPVLFQNLPTELNTIIWHYKQQLECAEKRWDSFIMDLTHNQYHLFKCKVKTHNEHVCVHNFIWFAIHSLPAESRIYKKAVKQLLNY